MKRIHWLSLLIILIILSTFALSLHSEEKEDYEDHGYAYRSYCGPVIHTCCGKNYSEGYMFYAISGNG